MSLSGAPLLYIKEATTAQITERPDLASQFIDEAHRRYSDRPHPREDFSVGLTGLVTCLEKTWLRRHGMIEEKDDTEEFKLIVTVGSAYHGLLPPMDAPREQHVRLTVPGAGKNGETAQVTCYIDWLEPTDPSGDRVDNFAVPCELKTTRSSANKPPSEHYVEQLAGEVALSNAFKGRLYILYLAGNYRPPMPQMKVYEFDFAEDEIDGWKEELGKRLGLVLGDERPGLAYHRSWECKYCPAKESGACPGGKGDWDHGTFFDRVSVTELLEGFDLADRNN